VVLHWKKLGVLMVGPYGDWLRFPYEDTENLYIIPEIDCCRVITDNAVHVLQRVPPGTAALLRIGSIEPAAMLLDAADAFAAGSPASDEAARAIVETGQLEEAIETCIEAATREFDILLQKRLMRAASFGLHFSYKEIDVENQPIMGCSYTIGEGHERNHYPSATTLRFVEAARKLRVMNALRNPKVGVVITSSQYDTIEATGVIARLVAIQRPALATSMSKYLSLPRYVQLFARASKAAALIESDKGHSDSELAEAALRIIGDEGGSTIMNRGGYAAAASAAIKANRPGVANLLLMLESSVADKVPALISTGSYADAVAVATTAR
jgi:vacuolar protein sorting-associated protein 16